MSEAADKLSKHTQIGKSARKHDQGDVDHPYSLGTVVDEVFVVNEDYDPYKSVVQKIEKADGSMIYRICYFVVTGKGTVGFGQYSPMLNGHDLCELMKLVIEKHWLGLETLSAKTSN